LTLDAGTRLALHALVTCWPRISGP
jgi:hypothetical protein